MRSARLAAPKNQLHGRSHLCARGQGGGTVSESNVNSTRSQETSYQRIMREVKEQFDKEMLEQKNMKLETVLDKLLKREHT